MAQEQEASASEDTGWLRTKVRALGPVLYGTLLTTLAGYCLGAILKATGVANVDLLSWRVLASIALPLASSGDGEQSTAVVLIGDRYFEREFQQSSPLNRGELSRVLGAIEAGVAVIGHPVIAIDLDLSPTARPDPSQLRAQAQLDRALLSLAQRATVVLLCPFAVTEALRQMQLDWARTLVGRAPAGRIVFARPDLLVQTGAVLNFDLNVLSLGLVAGDAAAERPAQGASAGRPLTLEACEASVSTAPKLAKINFTGYRAYRSIEIDGTTPLADLLRLQPPRLVLLGGSYALGSDEFSSAAGDRLRGVEMHAAVAYSRVRPVGPVPALVDPLLQFTVVLVVAQLARRAARLAFALMRSSMPMSEGAAPAPWWRFMWGTDRAASPAYEATAWTRWLVGLVLLLGVFMILLFGFGMVSLCLMLLVGLWYDFLFMALVSFGKTCSVELRRMLDELALHAGGAAPVRTPQADAVAPYVLPFGIGLRAVVLLAGGGVLVSKLIAMFGS